MGLKQSLVVSGLAAFVAFSSPAQSQDAYRVAVLEDGPCVYYERIIQMMGVELDILMEDDQPIELVRDPAYSAEWDPARAPAVIEAALSDAEVDAVLAAGVLINAELVRKDTALSKPLVNAYVYDPETERMPYDPETGRSTKKNYNFVVIPLRVAHDVALLLELAAPKKVGVLIDALILETALNQAEMEKQRSRELGFDLKFIPIQQTAAETLSRLPDDLDAVYLTPGVRIDENEWQGIIDGLTERQLPTVSMMGHADVRRGVLAGLAPETAERLARRLALNLQQIAEGVPPEELGVYMHVDEELLMNARTAREIGYPIQLREFRRAKFVHREDLAFGEGRLLTLERAVERALSTNRSYTVQRLQTRSTRLDYKQAWAPLLPQVAGKLQYNKIDEDRAAASGGSQPESQSLWGVEASQVLFSDEAITGLRSAKKAYQSAKSDEQATRLDTIADVYNAYVTYVQALSLYRIQWDNLQLTRNNLELARVRKNIGVSGPEEVLRWETEEASGKSLLLQIQSMVDQSRVSLNRTMGEPQNTPWITENIVLETNTFYFMQEYLEKRLKDSDDIDVFGDFLVNASQRNAPELESLDLQMDVLRMELARKQRQYIVPEISASVTYDHYTDQDRVGLQPDQTIPVDDEEWVVAVQARLPLFSGGGRVFDMIQQGVLLNQLAEQRRDIAEAIEERVRNAYISAQTSYADIQLQRLAAASAEKNLDIVQDKYSRGMVSYLDLLDAQNQTFVSRQHVVIAEHSYLLDVVEIQRALSWFEIEQTDAEKQRWIDAYDAFARRQIAE